MAGWSIDNPIETKKFPTKTDQLLNDIIQNCHSYCVRFLSTKGWFFLCFSPFSIPKLKQTLGKPQNTTKGLFPSRRGVPPYSAKKNSANQQVFLVQKHYCLPPFLYIFSPFWSIIWPFWSIFLLLHWSYHYIIILIYYSTFILSFIIKDNIFSHFG